MTDKRTVFSFGRGLPAILLLLPLAGCAPPAPDEDEPAAGEIIATVNDKAITSAQYEVYARRRGEPPRTDEQRLNLINDLVSIELLVQAAERDGLDREPQVAGEIAVQRSAALAQAAIGKRLAEHPLSDEDLEAEYQRYLDEDGGEELRASHILVAAEDEARKLLAELDTGADFAELAAEHSLDGSGVRGGDLGWFEPDMMVEAFARAAAALDVGGLTREPVQTRFGWHIIRLDGRREAPPMPFEEIRDELRGYLQSRLIEAWVNELRESARVEIR